MSVIKKCLSCKWFRPEDQFTGRCRVEKGRVDHKKYPIMKHDDCCEQWKDAGQQYFIRLGWVNNQKSNQTKKEDG